MTYSSLHTHCHYSLDGIGTIPQWINAIKNKGLNGLAITDHGDASSLLELKIIGQKEGIKVLSGIEFYLVDQFPSTNYYHLTVWAKNWIGYQNICRLSSLSFHRDEVGPQYHFYKKPRISMQDLLDHHEGLMIGSGCLVGPLSKHILSGENDIVDKFLQQFVGYFGDDYYLELQPSVVLDEKTKTDKQVIVNKRLIELANEHDLKMIITPDAHMINATQKVLQDIKLNSRSGKSNWEFEEINHLYTQKELQEKISKDHSYLLPILPQLIDTTNEVMSKGQFELPKFTPILPNIDITKHPLYEEGYTQENLIIKILLENERIDFEDPVYLNRIKLELKTLTQTINLLPYFLLIEDLMRWCDNNKIVSGPGRGSAAGSLLCYGLKITHLDPIKWNLSFERFINEARIQKGTLPDIDMDFSDPERIKEYLIEKYGNEYVASIGVFQTTKTKSAIKDVLRKLRPEMGFMDVNILTNPLPTSPQGVDELVWMHEQLEKFPKLNNFMLENEDVYHAVIQLLGQSRQRGEHPCAVLVSSVPLKNIVPLWINNGRNVTQYSAKWVEALGLIKYDVLGLNTLTDIAGCIKLINERHNIVIDPYKLPLDDKKTWEAFQRADCETVFQFHTSVALNILKQIKAENLHDLAIVTTLGRPGPMDVGMDKVYIERRNNRQSIDYPHHALESILKDTYGVLCYQESVMQSFQVLGDFTAEEADEVRRAMGKKDKDKILSFKERFLTRIQEKYNDVSLERAKKIWDMIESFSRYGFNSAHAYSYALIGYICQYLRQNYPLEWYCSVFSNASKDDRKTLYSLIKNFLVLPDINFSKKNFYIQDNKIISSLSFVHGVGDKSLMEIISKQPFSSFEDFLTRINKRIVRRDIVANLIFAECFQNLEPHKSIQDLITILYSKLNVDLPKEMEHMTSLNIIHNKLNALPIEDVDYVKIFSDFVEKPCDSFEYVLNLSPEGKEVSVVGKIDKISVKKTKKEKEYLVYQLLNSNLNLRVIAWPEMAERFMDLYSENDIVQLWGTVNIWNDTVSVIANGIKKLEV